MKNKLPNRKILLIIFILIIGSLLVIYVINKLQGGPLKQDWESKFDISKKDLVEQIKQEENISRIVDLCFQVESVWVLTDCPREMLCVGPMCFETILDVVKERGNKIKYDLICEEIESRVLESQFSDPIKDEWEAEKCKEGYNLQ